MTKMFCTLRGFAHKVFQTSGKNIQNTFKGIVHPKRKLLSPFTHPCVVPKPDTFVHLRNTNLYIFYKTGASSALSIAR